MEDIINGFRIVDHVTCFSLMHVASGESVREPAYSTHDAALEAANRYLSWYYAVGFKEPNKKRIQWISVPTQDQITASRMAREHARKRDIPGVEYGITRINAAWPITY